MWVAGLVEWWNSRREVRFDLLQSRVGGVWAWESPEQGLEAPLHRTRLSVVPLTPVLTPVLGVVVSRARSLASAEAGVGQSPGSAALEEGV